jgi:hypothetical protein
MKFRTTVILLIIAAALALFIYLYKGPGTQEARTLGKMLFEIKGDLVTKVSLTGAKGRLAFERREEAQDKWRILEPIEARANDGVVTAMVSRLEFLEKKRTFSGEEFEKVSTQNIGLNPPEITVTVFNKEGKSETLKVGAATINLDRRYAAKEGVPNEIYMIDAGLFESLDKSLKEVRAETVVDVSDWEVEKLDLAAQGHAEISARKLEKHWEITKPVATRADKDKIDEILRKLKELKVKEYVSEKPDEAADYALDAPLCSVSFYLDEEKATTVLFGKKKVKEDDEEHERGYAMVKGMASIYEISPYEVDDFMVELNKVRSKKIIHFSSYHVDEFTLSRKEGAYFFSKMDNDWQMTKPKEMPCENKVVNDVLNEAEDLEALDFPADKPTDLGQFGLDAPAYELSYTLDPDASVEKKEGVLFFGKTYEKEVRKYSGDEPKMKKLCYVKSSLEDSIFGIDASFLDYLAKDPLHFRERRVLDFRSVDVDKLQFKKGAATFDLVYRDYAWRMEKPVKADANDSGVADLVYELSSLEAEKFLAEDETMREVYGLDAPSIELVIGFSKDEDEPEKEPETLYVGKELPDNTYTAYVGGSNLIFTIPKSVHGLLTQELHSVEVFDFDVEQVVGISIKGPGNLVIQRKNGGWGAVEPATLAVSSFKTEEFLEGFCKLATRRFAAYSPADLKPFGLDRPAVTLEFSFPENAEALMIGAQENDAFYAKKRGLPGVFYLAAETVSRLLSPEQVFAKEVKPPAGDINLKIPAPGGGEEE